MSEYKVTAQTPDGETRVYSYKDEEGSQAIDRIAEGFNGSLKDGIKLLKVELVEK